MLSRREVVWLIGLMIAAVMMVGCVPNGFFEQTATVTLTETLTPAITETLNLAKPRPKPKSPRRRRKDIRLIWRNYTIFRKVMKNW